MSDDDEPRRKRVKPIPLLIDDEPRRKRAKPTPLPINDEDDYEPRRPGFASKLLKKSVLIPTGILLLGLIVGGVVVFLVIGRGVSPANMSGQERQDYERVIALEKEFAGIKRQETQELEDANRSAGQLDRPGEGMERMTAALGRADVREKRKREIQIEYGSIVSKYPHWGKPTILT